MVINHNKDLRFTFSVPVTHTHALTDLSFLFLLITLVVSCCCDPGNRYLHRILQKNPNCTTTSSQVPQTVRPADKLVASMQERLVVFRPDSVLLLVQYQLDYVASLFNGKRTVMPHYNISAIRLNSCVYSKWIISNRFRDVFEYSQVSDYSSFYIYTTCRFWTLRVLNV